VEKRKLGNTGLELSIIGFGGFHIVELETSEAGRILNRYLDSGGNYIESAAGYGDGNSEKKIGKTISGRRSEYYLATKTKERTKREAAQQLDRSLKNLKTDYVDIYFMHEVQTQKDLDTLLSQNGALQAAQEAQQAGKVRFIGLTGHGRQHTMEAAIEQYPFDVCMTGYNYYDRFNYPHVEDRLLPKALEKGVGCLGMKALADGYLYKSFHNAIRYTLSLPIASLVLGMNSEEYLEKDLEIAENFTPMSEEEKERLFNEAPELGDYVCRLCGKCKQNGFDPSAYFLLEGLYDRQMDARRLEDTSHYALREFLKFWFDQKGEAQQEYSRLDEKIDPGKDYSHLNKLCPYGIDIDRKLKITHDKLGNDEYIY
jgi:predicted aldo/keto reductase-like oxidoreductase